MKLSEYFQKFWIESQSGDNVLNFMSLRYLPRWVVLFIDVFLCLISGLLTFALVTKLDGLNFGRGIYIEKIALLMFFSGIGIYLFKTYAGIIRHSTVLDLLRIAFSCLFSGVLAIVCNLIYFAIYKEHLFAHAAVALYFLMTIIVMSGFRMMVKAIYRLFVEMRTSSIKQPVLIAGISAPAVSLATAILENSAIPFQVMGFLTKRKDSHKARLLGKKIYNFYDFAKLNPSHLGIEGIIIIKEIMTKQELEEWVNFAFDKGLKIYKSPNVGKFRFKEKDPDINALQIEDLLQRSVIEIDHSTVANILFDKNVLVTGGAGSIGSEIVRQVSQFKPKEILILDQAESGLFDLQQEILKKFPTQNFKFIVADVSQRERIEKIFKKENIHYVYHAAAYKHVPLMEENPAEAVRVNIQGTKNLADLAYAYQIEGFVMVSTDKAVNPTNVMGASKRVAELYVQSLQQKAGLVPRYITTRFGNVLGSNGSVIPLFKKQIAAGGPVTVTHPEITRYFMTIPEACELVLEASAMGKGGEIYVFDMGKPVRIADMAKRMIKLSGHEPDIDIKILYTGLRPGEKLYEELLSDGAKTLPTHHKKIMISKDSVPEHAWVANKVECLINVDKYKEEEMVKLIKELVPEFKSQNSRFEALDHK